MSEKQFVGSVKPGKYPDTLRLGFKLDQLPEPNENGYINLLIKKSRSEKWYCEVDTWRPSRESNQDQDNW